MVKRYPQAHSQQHGFTIVELMIATVIFSVVLLLVTVAILQITHVYYKGLTESNTQNTARAIMDDVSQAIQFSGGPVGVTPGTTPGTPYAFCIGNQRYSYLLGYQVVDNPASGQAQAPHALVADTPAGCAGSSPQDLLHTSSVSGRELVDTNMRLAKFSVTTVGTNLYKVDVKVVYGDDDLLSDPTGSDAACLGINAGTQFCAVSELTTIVQKRVQ